MMVVVVVLFSCMAIGQVLPECGMPTLGGPTRMAIFLFFLGIIRGSERFATISLLVRSLPLSVLVANLSPISFSQSLHYSQISLADMVSDPMRRRKEEEEGISPPSPISRDLRRYYCDYCGICRSKKSLICAHIQLQHKRSFTCPVDDCNSSYRRKDHLTRHLLQHQGNLFICPIENCNRKFTFQGNMKRHVKELHDEDSHDSDVQKEHICQGDFLESDDQFWSRACGGRETKSITVVTLLRTRVVLPGQSSILDNTDQSNLNWLLSEDTNEHQG